MKAKKWQRTVSLLLCLLMAMSFFVVTAPKAYAADGDSTEGLPHLTKFTVTTGYIYNKSPYPKVACKIKESAVSLKEKKENRKVGSKAGDFIGTIQITVEQPVNCTYNSSDKTTTTGDPISTLPTELVILSRTCAGECSDESYKISTTTVKFAPKEEGSNVYTVKATALSGYPNIKAGGTTYYYDCEIKIDTSARENTAPTIKAGLSNSLTVSAEANQPWRIDLSEIFEDAEGDTLTYTVSVNDAEAQSVNGSTYSYTLSEEATSATLVFKASDGALESEAYTVTLTKEAVTYHKITTSVDGSYQWNTVTRDMGKISASVEGGKIDSVRVGSTVKLTAEALKFELQFGGLLYDAQLSSWEVSGVSLDDAQKASDTLTFEMPDNDVTIKAVFVRKGSSVTLKANYADRGELNLFVNGGFNESNSTYSSESGHIKDVVQDRVIADASVSAELRAPYKQAFSLAGWTIRNETSGSDLDPAQITYTTKTAGGESYQAPTFKVDGKSEYSITAIFEAKDYGAVNVTVNDTKMGEATAQVDGGEASSSLTVVYEGVTVKLKATPEEGFIFKSWKASYGDDTQVTIADENAAETTFKMPQTGEKPVNVVAEFAVDPSYLSEDCALTDVTLLDNTDSSIAYYGDQDLTNFTIEVPADTDNAKLAGMILKLTVSDDATVKKSGDTDNWPAAGKACGMELDKAATFTVTAENGDKQNYKVAITRDKSSEKDITAAVLLNQTGDTTPFAKAQISETNIIFTLPSDTNKADLNSIGLKYLKLTYPESATAKMVDATGKDAYGDADGTAKWRNGDVKCNMSLNTPVKFVITAEDGSPKEYTVEIKYTAPAAPTLSGGSATRSSKTAATVKFTTNEAGTYYYKVVSKGATATVDTTKNGTRAVKGENTITLTNLTADARDVYIVVVSAAGGESAPLKVEIPAYDGGSDTPDTGAYKISVSVPKGGTITTNRTKADAGDEIIVTVIPNSGYQMVEGSLTYTLATDGGETVKITGSKFTMPASDVSITCKWETATTTAKGITSFSINGIAGAVNNTTNTITITMPRGTDVTKLTPVIATNDVKSLTPGSGETVNFTTSVTYTATMEDGSTKTYTVTVYVEKGTLSDQFWDKLTDFVNQIPWWEYAKHQQSTSSYPKYW